ncbi:MAG: DUF992 domain-containing protein [Rhizobiales bacterium]|nr:DUF992 domain-containing protein [Hyphomicrobiales bacterium]
MKKFVAVLGMIAAGGLMAMAPGESRADVGIKVGTLICDVSGGIGLIIGSSKSVRCTYSRASDGREEFYTGSINKFGLDVGVTSNQTMAWVVFAPGQVGAGSLSGNYVGATAEATAGAGIGANALIGGFNNTVTLQPLSVQAQTGLNVAAGVANLRLSQ